MPSELEETTRKKPNWFQRQIIEYRIQKAIAERDHVTRDAMSEQTRRTTEIDNTPDLTPLEREERQLDMRKNLYEPANAQSGISHRYMEANAHLQDTISLLRDDPGYTNDGRGIGGFFGRLFNGRFFKSSRDMAAQENQQFNSMPGFSRQDEQRLNQLKADRQARTTAAQQVLGAEKADPECSDNTLRYFYESYKSLKGEAAPKTYQEFVEMHTHIANQRQLTGFLKPTPEFLEYNAHVIGVLTDLDENGKFRNQAAAVQIFQDRLHEIDQAVDVNAVNLADTAGTRQMYPAMAKLYRTFHPILDLTKANGGCFTNESFRQVFPTPESYEQLSAKANFVMNVCDQTRAQLIRESGDDMRFALDREKKGDVSMKDIREQKEHRLQGVTGLNGATNYRDFCEAAKSKHAYPTVDRSRWAQQQPAREKVSADTLKREAGLGSAEQQKKTEAPAAAKKEPALTSQQKSR